MTEIPKIVHYCWFGGRPLGDKEQACIESWERFFPDYEIKRWDESSFDVRCCDYVSEAYDTGMWAFVSDYARYKILYDCGGLYFDTDVEVIKHLYDIIDAGPFMGFESDFGDATSPNVAAGLDMAVNPGLGLGATAGLDLYRMILDSYHSSKFLKNDGAMDKTSVVFRTTRVLEKLGLKKEGGIQRVAGVTIYPSEYFNPKSYLTGAITLTEHTRTIHHFNMSWFTRQERFQHDVNAWMLRHGVGETSAKYVSTIASVIRFADYKRIYKYFVKKQ